MYMCPDFGYTELIGLFGLKVNTTRIQNLQCSGHLRPMDNKYVHTYIDATHDYNQDNGHVYRSKI